MELCGKVKGVDGLSHEACVKSGQEDGPQEDFVCPACGHREHKKSNKISCAPDAGRDICERNTILTCSKCGADCDVKPCDLYGKENFKETPAIMEQLHNLR